MRFPSLLNSKKRRLREDLMAATAPHEEGSGVAVLSSSLVTEQEATAWSCVRGGSDWKLGKDSSPEGGWAAEQAPWSSSHSAEPEGVQEAF